MDEKIEKDAVPTTKHNRNSVSYSECSENNEIVEVGDNQVGRMMSSNMVLAQQTNQSTIFNFDNCTGITLGQIGWSPGNFGNNGAVARTNTTAKPDESVYKKTPTIKSMLESTEPISTAFLDSLSGSFGSRWREVTILLQINQLFVDRMYEDFFDKSGTKEVVFQILSKYLKDHEEKAYVGWFISFLWRNGFKQTVWTVKEHYKKLKELEKDFG